MSQERTSAQPDVARGSGSAVPRPLSCAQFLITKHFAPLYSDLTKLVRVASMFDRASGRYVEPTAASWFGEQLVDAELRDLHLRFFRAWLSHTLEDQTKEFDTCGPPHTEARAALLKWAANDGERLIPTAALEAERMLFQHDLGIVLYLLSTSAPDRQRDGAETANGSYEPDPQPATC